MTYKNARRVIVIILGLSVLLIGIAMIVLPGPAILLIPAGLAILATELIWARILLNKIKSKTKRISKAAQKLIFGDKEENKQIK
jgi:tellurite resistance protein TerC